MPLSSRHQELDRFEVSVISLVSGVAVVGAMSLLLAAIGALRLWLWLPIAATVVTVVALLLLRQSSPRWSGARWFAVVPLVLVALVLMVPGYRYATGDKDPGIYVMHAWNMAHSGHLPFQKTALQMSGVLTSTDYPGTLWRGFEFSTSATQVMPSFFHMWSALLAAGFQLVGFNALAVMGPLLGALAVLLLFAFVRRLFSGAHAVVAALLLSVNMMQVWQARYPTSEMLAQVLYIGAALALLTAVHTRHRLLAVIAGMLATSGFLVRVEGVVALAFFGALLAVLAMHDTQRRVVTWGWIGALVPLPLAWWQAYGWASKYASTNGVPSKQLIALVLLVEVAATVGLMRWSSRSQRIMSLVVTRLAPLDRTFRRVAGAAVVALFVVAFLRPLTGVVTAQWNGRGRAIRTFDERSLHRLAMFFTWPGLLLALAGVALIVLRQRGRAVAVFTAVSMFYVVLFLYHARNSPQMMWWNRRFVPSVVPAVVVFAAVGLVDGWQWLHRAVAQRSAFVRRLAAAVVALGALFAVAVPARQSWYLRANNEKTGSFEMARGVAALASDESAVFLWQRGPCCGAAAMLFGSPTWVYGGVDSALLPVDPTLWEEYISSVHDAAPALAIYVVIDHGTPPPAGAFTTAHLRRFNGALHAWEESNIRRPSHVIALPYDVEVYRVGWAN